MALSSGGHEAASCSVSPDLDTHLAYAVDGDCRFWVAESFSAYSIDDLPEGLRVAALSTKLFGSSNRRLGRAAAENLALLCALGDFSLTLNDLRRLPLLGTLLERRCEAVAVGGPHLISGTGSMNR